MWRGLTERVKYGCLAADLQWCIIATRAPDGANTRHVCDIVV